MVIITSMCCTTGQILENYENKLLINHKVITTRLIIHFYSGICNVKFSTESGTIMSPNYPQEYPNSVKCEWIIDLSPRYEITLTFHEFMLEDHSRCRNDRLMVKEGNNPEARRVFRGCSDIPPDMVISGPGRISFKTDHSNQFKGFHITWAAKG